MEAESIPADPGSALEAELPTLKCPTCTDSEKFYRQEDLNRHRERHRPLVERTPESVKCPKKCGRWLVPSMDDTTSHIALCDGLKPLVDKTRAQKKPWFCDEHGYETSGPKAWGMHKKEFHGGEDPRPIKVVGNVEQAVDLLKKKRSALMQEIERIDSAIKILAPDPGIEA